ncbi:MAG: hypothetical protein Q7U13_10830 [Rhodoferax sp.]|nr:hypothetical protein [Rhodoferax sp.]
MTSRHHAPSVGFMQPWRFIRVRKPEWRADIQALVAQDAAAPVLQVAFAMKALLKAL